MSGPDEEPHILTLRELEAEHIRRVLGLGVSMERAAELLGINTVTPVLTESSSASGAS